MARQTRRGNGAAEAVVREFVARREIPFLGPGIEREWGLKEVIASAHDVAVAVSPRADYILELVGGPEDVLSGGVEFILALVQAWAFAKHAEVALPLLVGNGDGRW